MRLFGKVNGVIDRFDRAQWLSPPFDLAFATISIHAADLMAAVVARLESNSTLVSNFGHSTSTPKFHADEVDPGVALPYLLHSDPEETPRRFHGGRIGEGTFEIGVFAAGYETARALMDGGPTASSVRLTLDSWVSGAPVDLDDGGRIFYLRSIDGAARSIRQTATGSSVAIYGRALRFAYKIARSDP